MKRLVVSLLAFVVLGAAVCIPAILWNRGGSSDDSAEPTRITRYLATFDVSDDGSMAVREMVSVEFPAYPSRHGIFRYFDRADPNAPRLRRDVDDVSVWMDGSPAELEVLEESHGRYEVARIGSATRTVSPGVHTYEIRYTVQDALAPTAGGSRFYWNLVPGGWRQPIDQARLRVNLPGDTADVRCAVGQGSVSGCTTKGDGTPSLVVRAENLAPMTPVTVTASVDHAVPAPRPDRLWGPRLDPVLGSSTPVLGLVLILTLAAAGAGILLVRRSLESTPPFPLVYSPPPGVGPAQAQYLLTERLDQRAFVATVMHMAELQAVDLDHDASGWRITPRPGGLERLDPVTATTARMLGLHEGVFRASPDSASDGQALKTAIQGFERSVRGWAREQGLMATAGLGGMGGMIVLMAAAVAVAVMVFNPFDMTALALVPGAFAACGLGILVPGASTRRTASGREFWSRAGGFRRVLSTPSSKDRFEFSGRQELYTAYVPWAIAFGVADEWAAKYRTEVGLEPPLPAYFAGGYAGDHSGNHVTQMVQGFDGTVSSAISSYEATQSSSGGGGGGGGGGFSGGGGGGGGGGGSW